MFGHDWISRSPLVPQGQYNTCPNQVPVVDLEDPFGFGWWALSVARPDHPTVLALKGFNPQLPWTEMAVDQNPDPLSPEQVDFLNSPFCSCLMVSLGSPVLTHSQCNGTQVVRATCGGIDGSDSKESLLCYATSTDSQRKPMKGSWREITTTRRA